MTDKARMWLVQRSAQDQAGKWQVRDWTFGPSPLPPPDAIVFWRNSVENPTWVPAWAQDWEVTGDPEIRRRTSLDDDAVVPMPPEIRAALARVTARLAEGRAV